MRCCHPDTGPDGQRGRLVAAKAGEHHEFVNQCPLAPSTFERSPLFVADLGQRLALVLAAPDGKGIQQRAFPSRLEQSGNLILAQRPALSRRLGLLSLGKTSQRI